MCLSTHVLYMMARKLFIICYIRQYWGDCLPHSYFSFIHPHLTFTHPISPVLMPITLVLISIKTFLSLIYSFICHLNSSLSLVLTSPLALLYSSIPPHLPSSHVHTLTSPVLVPGSPVRQVVFLVLVGG